MKNKKFEEIEFSKDKIEENKLIEQIDLGVNGNNLEELVEKINIPYEYLDNQIRERIDKIFFKIIKPSLQDKIRAHQEPRFLNKEFARKTDRIVPDKMDINVFHTNLKNIYVQKINSQNTIAIFLKETLKNRDDLAKNRHDIVSRGMVLYNRALKIEPLFFVYSSKIKDFIEYANKKFFEQSLITHDENLMLLTPSQPTYFIKKEIDFMKYKISDREHRKEIEKKLIRLYFNNEPLYFKKNLRDMIKREGDVFLINQKEKESIKKKIAQTKEIYQSFYNKKFYFLLERKTKHSKEVDELLIIDNCLDKYLESKLCFLHDLFLKTYLIKWSALP